MCFVPGILPGEIISDFSRTSMTTIESLPKLSRISKKSKIGIKIFPKSVLTVDPISEDIFEKKTIKTQNREVISEYNSTLLS